MMQFFADVLTTEELGAVDREERRPNPGPASLIRPARPCRSARART